MEREEYEHILLCKNEVFIFKIPPRTTNRAVRASDWKLDQPDWTGRLKLIAKGDKCTIRLEDKNTGQLFAECPIDTYPGLAIEPVSDSSRYFVIRLKSDDGRSAFIGIGFSDRGDSFDLNVALQDHFKLVEKQSKLEQEESTGAQPKLDLKFKEGQTIKVNLNIAKKSGANAKKSKGLSGLTGILPPPPGGIKIPPPSDFKPAAPSKGLLEDSENDLFGESLFSSSNTSKNSNSNAITSSSKDLDDLADFDSLSISRANQDFKAAQTQSSITCPSTTNSTLSSELWANFDDDSTQKSSTINTTTTEQSTQQQQSNWASF
ncbi:NECAP-like protein CG9132 [Brevipalpus obovatus]|uniref:NECAP-like protein CG9132 n=1 Tax=Brevipalpus obovatus TaxID=246614 RepID=UPI003D9F5D7D